MNHYTKSDRVNQSFTLPALVEKAKRKARFYRRFNVKPLAERHQRIAEAFQRVTDGPKGSAA